MKTIRELVACGDQEESSEVKQMKEEFTKAEYELEQLTDSAVQASRASEDATRAEKLALKRESDASAFADAARVINSALNESKLEVLRSMQQLEHQEDIKKNR